MKAGSVKRRCSCRHPETGKQYGASCPKATKKGHGSWAVRQELPPGDGGSRRVFRRSGYSSADLARSDLDKARALLVIPSAHDLEMREAVATLLTRISASKEPIPDVDETKRLLLGGQDPTDSGTIGGWLDEWLEIESHRPATELSYESHVRLYLKPHIGHIRRDRFKVVDVARMFRKIEDQNERTRANNSDRKLLQVQIKQTRSRAEKRLLRERLASLPPFRRPVGQSSMVRIRATLRAALNDAISQQIMTFNAAAHYEMDTKRPKPKVWTAERVAEWKRTGLRPYPVMVWTPEQTATFDAYARADQLYAMWRILTFRGLRRGEACGLREPDVDLLGETKGLHVVKQLTEVDYEVEESDPKSEAGERWVALDQESVQVIRAYLAQKARNKADWGDAWVESGRAFTRENGEALRPSWVSERFARLAAEAGLPPIRLHDLRHGAATLALAAGVDLKTVQELLGHSSITVTSDTYTSVLPEVAMDAAEAIAGLIKSRATSNGHPSGTPGDKSDNPPLHKVA